MTTKPIYHKVKIHFLFYVFAFIASISGMFQPFILFTSLLLIHECGHVMMALYYGWNIEKIVILPFGGLTVFQEKLNRSWNQEFLILLAGPGFQICFYAIMTFLGVSSPLFTFFNWALLGFNLLPILPLDGSKLVLLLLEKIFPYRLSQCVSFGFSCFFLCLVAYWSFFQSFYLLFWFILFFLFVKTVSCYLEKDHLYSKFLLERVLYSFSFPKTKKIIGEKIHLMYRDCEHYFFIDHEFVEEAVLLKKKFDFKGKL